MGLIAYSLWGFLPIYWKWLGSIPPFEILAHRILWSFVFIVAVLALTGALGRTWGHLRDTKRRRALVLSTALIGANWGIFIYAVAVDRVSDASLGYYINPLFNVLIGGLFLGETLRGPQRVAVALAAMGVTWLTYAQGSLPWISLVLALTFCLYGLVRRRLPVKATEGLAIETGLTVPVALAYLLWLTPPLGDAMQADAGIWALLVGSGVVTAIPLLAFAGAAMRLEFATLGMIQFLAPSLQLACAVLIYDKPFGRDQAVAFAFIWAAVLLYAGDAARHAHRSRTS